MSDHAAPGQALLSLWRRLSPLPGGPFLFRFILSWRVPYTGTLHARVLQLDPGLARVAMHERRLLRNHLGSVHALALANLGELCSGLALLTALPAGVRGIVTRLSTDYLKKARGELIANSRWNCPKDGIDGEHETIAEIHNSAGELVARTRVQWRLQSPESAYGDDANA